jgi:hypothetical protein
VMAAALIAGAAPQSLHDSFPTLAQVARLAYENPAARSFAQLEGIDPRVFGGFMLAGTLGWRILEPFLVIGLGLGDMESDELHRQVTAMIHLVASSSGRPDAST